MAARKRSNRKKCDNLRCRIASNKLKESETSVERRKLSTVVAPPSHLLCHLIFNRDLCEYVTTNRNRRTMNNVSASEPDVQPARGDRPRTPVCVRQTRQFSSPQSRPQRQPRPATTIADLPRSAARIDQTVWQYLKSFYDFVTLGFRTDNQLAVIENAPDNSVSNLFKMILVPILLAFIAVMIIPLARDIGSQTFSAIFYNHKVSENRQANLKRVSIGASLVLNHMIRKIFPIVRLRWLNSNLFKRRAERGSVPIPPVANQR